MNLTKYVSNCCEFYVVWQLRLGADARKDLSPYIAVFVSIFQKPIFCIWNISVDTKGIIHNVSPYVTHSKSTNSLIIVLDNLETGSAYK